jgi:GTP-dependent phosphoenolpyruvate carboxykinase
MPDADVRELLTVDPAGWRRECDEIADLFARFGDRVPRALARRLHQLRWRLGSYA